MTTTRTQVYDALFALLQTAMTFKVAAKRFQTWDQIQAGLKPALFLTAPHENHIKQKLITPAIRMLTFDCFIFISSGLNPNKTPADEIDAIIDLIDPTSGGVLRPGFDGRQTLGGLVTDCYIEGEIVKSPGDLDGQGCAIIPIVVMFM